MKTRFLLFCACLFFSIKINAQVLGCTDPLANNYNANATKNNGTCTYNPTTADVISSNNLPSQLLETSGLTFWNNLLFTHNDNDDLKIYAIDTTNGSIINSYNLNGTANIDWEEISQDENYFYVGDFGNNSSGNRTNLKILRIYKSSILNNNLKIDTINFSYSNQTDFTATAANKTDFDCEAFVVTTDSIYLFTKQWNTNQTSLYALSKTPGTYKAQYKNSYDVQGLVTGATLLENKKLVVLCGYNTLLQPFTILLYDYESNNFFSGNKRKINLNLAFHQVEGIATNNGLKYFISNEFFSKSVVTVNQKLQTLNFYPYLSNYLGLTNTSTKNELPNNAIAVYPNPVKHTLNIDFKPNKINGNYLIINNIGKIVLEGNFNQNTNELNVASLQNGVYQLIINNHQTIKFIKE
jgi:hypothetical protein